MMVKQQVKKHLKRLMLVVVFVFYLITVIQVLNKQQSQVEACFLPSHEQARLQLLTLLSQYPDLLGNNYGGGIYGNNQMMPNGQRQPNGNLNGGYPNNMQGNGGFPNNMQGGMNGMNQNPYGYGNQQGQPNGNFGGFSG